MLKMNKFLKDFRRGFKLKKGMSGNFSRLNGGKGRAVFAAQVRSSTINALRIPHFPASAGRQLHPVYWSFR